MVTREIKGLSSEAHFEIMSTIPRAVQQEKTVVHEDMTNDIVLSDTCIIKCYDNSIVLDHGGMKVSINEFDFVRIEMW